MRFRGMWFAPLLLVGFAGCQWVLPFASAPPASAPRDLATRDTLPERVTADAPGAVDTGRLEGGPHPDIADGRPTDQKKVDTRPLDLKRSDQVPAPFRPLSTAQLVAWWQTL